MIKLTQKIVSVGVSLTTVIWLSGATMIMPIASAATTAELEAQIAALLASIQALQSQLNTAKGTTSSSYTFTKDLTLGSKGDDVTALQQTLIDGGYLKVAAPTGYFGSLTKSATAAWQKAQGVSGTGYFGPKSRAAYAAMAPSTGIGTGTTGTGTTGTGTVTPSGFVITLASNNPAGATLPKGASGIAVLKFTVSGTGTLDTLTFKRVGIGATGDFLSSGSFLYEGDTRLTSGKTINSTTHEIQFASLGLAVAGTRTFSLVMSIASGATASNMSAFNLTGATGTPTPTKGTVAGNSFTIGGQAVGGVEIAGGATPTNPKIGQVAAKVSEFTLTASSTEDIEISKIALTEGGTITNDYITNAVLKQGGNTLATAAKIGSKDLLTFALATPFKLEKGQQRTFEVYADIGGNSRVDDTIGFYIDNIADISGKGFLYGYAINPNIATTFDAVGDRQLTVAGGQITITFNGPVASDVSLRGQDVTVYDFTIASQNNIEIKNLRMHATTTGLASGDGFNDMKVWDVTANAVLTSATDITTSTDQTFTDTITLAAGQSRRFKVTVDVDPDNEDADDILVSLLVFNSTDIKNLDNNTNVTPSSSVVPNSTVAGNTQTTRLPTLDVQLASTPTSQTYVKGVSGQALVGFSFRATGGDIRLDMLKITASSTSGTLGSGEMTNLKLYDGATQIGDTKSLAADSVVTTAFSASFTGLNQTITKGTTKIYTVKGDIPSDAGAEDRYYIYINAASSVNLTIYDKDGNSATITGTTANSGNTVVTTVKGSGDVTVTVTGSSDTDSSVGGASEAGIILAGKENTLGKYNFLSTNEEMTINKMQILVVSTNNATATSGAASDDVPTIKLYESYNGALTQIGNTAGYSVTASGDFSGVAFIDSLGWKIPKDTTKTLVVKGVVSAIGQNGEGADQGTDVYASIMNQANSTYTFEAQGASAKDTTITAATGYRKIVYKTKPTFSTGTTQPTGLVSNLRGALRFKISADSSGEISWKKAVFQVAMQNATMSAASLTNVVLNDINTGALSLASAYSGTTSTAATTVTITNGNTGYVGIELTSEERVTAGATKEYELQLTFANVESTAGGSKATTKLYRYEFNPLNATWYSGVLGALVSVDTDMNPNFVWSDLSNTGHTANVTTTADWANGVYVKPGSFTDITNTLSN